ncbi:MAG: hypothetical protein GWP09_02965 [Nitrospiraceae bacterium]|nr:hypothetical protein [Nitrospiraceae bacterium]
MNYKHDTLSNFNSGPEKEVIFLGYITKNVSFTLPFNSVVNSASFIVKGTSNSIMKLNRSSGEPFASDFIDMSSGPKEFYVFLPNNSRVIRFFFMVHIEKPSVLNVTLLNGKTFSFDKITLKGVLLNTTKINDFLSKCNQPECKVNFSISSDADKILLDKINGEYFSSRPNVSFPKNVSYKNISAGIFVNVTNFSRQMLVSDNIKCEDNYCNISIPLTANNTKISVSNLTVDYDYYDFKEDLFDAIVSCWRDSDYGQSDNSKLCSELTIPSSYKFKNPLTEASFARYLKKTLSCGIIADSAFGCGSEKDILFKRNFSSPTNVLVKYDGYLNEVVVE